MMVLKIVLFVCVGNSFRSQIAEAYFNAYAPKGWRAVSAGSRPKDGVHPDAVALMKEEGIDISRKKPRLLEKEFQDEAEVAVVVCGGAECPLVYAKKVERWDVSDPAKMSLNEAREIRDTIKWKVLSLVKELEK